ncbi:MADS-box protein SOC1-like isoform X2 [Gossypium raimondii]|uniref:MADS-box protein SOC1-like isoform X2 n=1 Tax=Gossypium raimondii TaxID=29730 RepID=UPI00063ACD99|nr:MADS-box protein SOC1-like isoform X2 [Gossypium raimondii]
MYFSREIPFWRQRRKQKIKGTKILIMVRGKAQMMRIENDTSSNQQTIERYRRHTKDNETNKPIEQNLQHLKAESANMLKTVEDLEVSRSNKLQLQAFWHM